MFGHASLTQPLAVTQHTVNFSDQPALQVLVKPFRRFNGHSDKTQCKLKGKFLGIFSPVDVKIFDQKGDYSGPNAFGGIDENIPGVTYEVFGDKKFVFLPTDNGQVYNIILDATDKGDFDFKITSIDDQEVGAVFYNDIGINSNSLAKLEISQSSSNTSFDFDFLGNGNLTKLSASAILNAQEGQDDVPPMTITSLEGLIGLNEWYRSGVKVSLGATDDNSGVLVTEYSINGGAWQIYIGSFSISAEGVTTVDYRSTDRAGNQEIAKSKTIKIDFGPPEVIISFDLNLGDLKFAGFDNLSANVKVDDLGSRVVLTDEAGNITELLLKERERKRSLRAELLKISYNQVEEKLNRNRFVFQWQYNKLGQLQKLLQRVLSKEELRIELEYDAQSDRMEIKRKDHTGVLKETKPGLIILKIKTNKGKIEYEY